MAKKTNTKSVRLPKFKRLDLRKRCTYKGEHKFGNHPDIRGDKQYLVTSKEANGPGMHYSIGSFGLQWYGWVFDDGVTTMQLDSGHILGLWEIS